MLRQVKTENGWVRGIEAADPRITAFKGIPFAAPDDDSFEAKWADMVAEIDGADYETLFNFDVEKWQVQVDAKIAAAAGN